MAEGEPWGKENESWRETIEKMLAADELKGKVQDYTEKIEELLNTIRTLEPLCGTYSGAVYLMLRDAAEGYPALPAVYIGFLVGIAYERNQNKEGV